MAQRLDILVIEENDRSFALTRDLLKRQSGSGTIVTISRALSMESALEQLKGENFDLVLVDLPLGPEKEITQSFRSLQNAAESVPIVSLRPASDGVVIGDAIRLEEEIELEEENG